MEAPTRGDGQAEKQEDGETARRGVKQGSSLSYTFMSLGNDAVGREERRRGGAEVVESRSKRDAGM